MLGLVCLREEPHCFHGFVVVSGSFGVGGYLRLGFEWGEQKARQAQAALSGAFWKMMKIFYSPELKRGQYIQT